MSVDPHSDVDARMDVGAIGRAVLRRLPRILAVTVLLMAATWGVLHFVPKMYESSASLLVAPRDNSFTRPTGDTTSQTATVSPAAIASQIQLIQSRDTLLPVIDQLGLRKVPEFNGSEVSPLSRLFGFLGHHGKPANIDDVVLRNLDDRLTVIQQRNSDIVSILVDSEDPQLAAKIANAIANAHVRRQAALSVSDTAEASDWLKGQIDKMRKQVSDAEAKVANFRIENDLYTGANNTSLPDQQLTDIQNQITAAQGRKNDAQSRADLIRQLLAQGKPIDSVSDIRNSVVVQRLSEQKAQLETQRAQLLATLLPNHPSVRAVDAQIAAIDKQVTAEGRHVADALTAEAKVEGDIEASLREDLARAKQNSAAAAKNGVTLDELQREATAQRQVLDNYLTRYREAASRADASAALPDVRVVTVAAAPVLPASPKTSLILAAVAFIALALQIGAIIFRELISGRAIIERHRPAAAGAAVFGAVYLGNGDYAPAGGGAAARIVTAEPQMHEGEGRPDTAADDGESSAPVPQPAETAGLRPSRHPPADAFAEEPMPAGADPEEARADAEAQEAVESNRSEEVDADGDFESVALHPDALASLSADMALGRVRVITVADLSGVDDAIAVADTLVADAVHMGLSIVRVDAASTAPTTEPGISDLAAGTASFGDVIYPGSEEGVALVPWGHADTLDRTSPRPAALIEALSDLYEVVVVLAGSAADEHGLALFGTEGRLVLVATGDTDFGTIHSARSQAEQAGFRSVQLVAPPRDRAVA